MYLQYQHVDQASDSDNNRKVSPIAVSSMDSVKIPSGKYPAKAHAKKVAEYLIFNNSAAGSGTIYIEGQKTRLLEDSDQDQPFRYKIVVLTMKLYIN